MLQARSVIGVLALLFCMKGAYALPRLYWIDHSDNVLRQYDGTATSAYDTSSLRILYGAMCEANGYLYFSHLGAIANEATIRRSTTNLTLSDSYTVPTTLDRQFTGLEVLPDESNFLFSDSITLYSAADAGGILSKSNLIDHADGLRFGRGIKVDEDNGKIYWVDSGVSLLTDTAANAIKRSNLDGTSVENLVSVGSVRDIALDLTNNKLYWADNANTPTIKRANLDGSSVETLITSGLTYVTGIGVDTTASKIYWLDLGSGTIKQSNLNGSSITTVVSEIGYGSALLVIDDACPSDDNKIAPGSCGCNVVDTSTDSDSDSTLDCVDECDSDPNKASAGVCGCGVVEAAGDSDGDDTVDCFDGCVNDANKIAPGTCGCGLFEIQMQDDSTVCANNPLFSAEDPLEVLPEYVQVQKKITVILPKFSGVASPTTNKKIKGATLRYRVVLQRIKNGKKLKKVVKLSSYKTVVFKNVAAGDYELSYTIQVLKGQKVLDKSGTSPVAELTVT